MTRTDQNESLSDWAYGAEADTGVTVVRDSPVNSEDRRIRVHLTAVHFDGYKVSAIEGAREVEVSITGKGYQGDLEIEIKSVIRLDPGSMFLLTRENVDAVVAWGGADVVVWAGEPRL